MNKRTQVLDNARFCSAPTKSGWAIRKKENGVSAREISDFTGIRIQYVCGVLNEAVEEGILVRHGTRRAYTYSNADA